MQSAQALQPDFALSAETAPAVARICQLVEGLPLGIELAAAWIRVLSCDEIAQEIGRNLDFLSSAMHDLPARQHSLRAVFDYSWNLLSAPEQQALRQLAVFRGSFTREAAAAVVELRVENEEFRTRRTAAAFSILRVLNSQLCSRRWSINRSSVASSTAGVARYEILELLRQYLAEHLARAGEADAAAMRHAAYYCAWMGARTADLRGKEQAAALAAIGGEIEQIRAAWRCAVANADSAALGRAADSLFHFYDMRSWFHEGAEAFGAASQALAAQPDAADQLVYGKLLARLGWFTFYLGRQAEAKALLEQSLAILRRLDARAELVFTLNYLGAVCSYLGDYAQTRALCRESLAIAEALGDRYGRAIACNILGQTAYEGGDYTEAQAWSQRSFALEQQIGNGWSMAFSLTNLGKVAYALGEYAEARWFFEQSLQTRAGLGDTRGVAICYNRLGDAAMALGSPAEAGQRYAQSLELVREIGNQWGMAESLINLGQLASTQARDRGRHAAAARGAAPGARHPGCAAGGDDYGRVGTDRAAGRAMWPGPTSWRILWPPSRSRSTHTGRRPNGCSAGRRPAQRHQRWSRRSPRRRHRPARSSATTPTAAATRQPPSRPDRARDRGAAAGGPRADRCAGGREAGAQPAHRQHAPDIDLRQAPGQLAQRRHALRGGEWRGVSYRCAHRCRKHATQPLRARSCKSRHE